MMLLSLLATCVSVASVQVVLISRALLFVVSILFKRDASYIDGVNICYLSKLLLHAMRSICYFWPWQEKHHIILHIFDVFMTNICLEEKWSVVSAKLGEGGGWDWALSCLVYSVSKAPLSNLY